MIFYIFLFFFITTLAHLESWVHFPYYQNTLHVLSFPGLNQEPSAAHTLQSELQLPSF